MHIIKRRGLINYIKILLTLSTYPGLFLPPSLLHSGINLCLLNINRTALDNFSSSVPSLERSFLFSPLPLLPLVDLLILPRNSDFQKFDLMEEYITQRLKVLRVPFPASALCWGGNCGHSKKSHSSPRVSLIIFCVRFCPCVRFFPRLAVRASRTSQYASEQTNHQQQQQV